MSIPGIGARTGARILTEIGDINRFPPQATWPPSPDSPPSPAGRSLNSEHKSRRGNLRPHRGLFSAGYAGCIQAVSGVSRALSVLLPWSAEAHPTATPTDGDVYLVCLRTGRPTVLRVAGVSNRADIWSAPADYCNEPTMVQLDQSGQVHAAIKRVVRAVRAGKRTTGHSVAIGW
jgi:hypothetical protein